MNNTWSNFLTHLNCVIFSGFQTSWRFVLILLYCIMENFHEVNGIWRSESYRSVGQIGTVLLYARNVFIHNDVSLPVEPVNEIRQDTHRSAALNRRPQNDVYILQSTYNAADSSRGTNKKYIFIHNENHKSTTLSMGYKLSPRLRVERMFFSTLKFNYFATECISRSLFITSN